jgi:hypothetical protein
MRSGAIPFRFDMSAVLKRLVRLSRKYAGAVTLNFPFISIAVNPQDREKSIAREIIIRLRDRRVLCAWECCDHCIDQALESLQQIRGFLTDKQVELADLQDGPLFVLVDAMASGIRQFLSFEQRLKADCSVGRVDIPLRGEGVRHPSARQEYFDGLELLRDHLCRCLVQVAKLGGIPMPENGLIKNYDGEWRLEAYDPVALPKL